MTMKPKVNRYNVAGTPKPEGAEAPKPAQQGTPNPAPQRTPRPPHVAKSSQPAQPSGGVSELQAIQNEGLTGRQLRMARRVAQKNGIEANSDYEAVLLLRKMGINPFERTGGLEQPTSQPQGAPGQPPQGQAMAKIDPVQLPQKVPDPDSNLPAPQMEKSPADQRAQEIYKVQRDLARRRRKRQILLLTRLAFFVFIPTLLAGYYFYNIATPLYSTKTAFEIIKADGGVGGGSPAGGLLSGTSFATSQDSIIVQNFLESKEAMLRLNEDVGFVDHFSQDNIDPLRRIPKDATNEQAYKVYKRNVILGFDPTEGVIKMEVISADHQKSAKFSRALIHYAEERVDSLSIRKRENQLTDAKRGYQDSLDERKKAQRALIELQQSTILDPEAVVASIRTQISALDQQLTDKKIELASQMTNLRPNKAKVDGIKADIKLLEDAVKELDTRMNKPVVGDLNLAQLTTEIEAARADLAMRDLMVQSALENLRSTEAEVSAQTRYLETSVVPIAAQDPSYPRKFENTLLAFLVFSGIYLIASITASILREQVTS